MNTSSGPAWSLAPIRWGGSVSSELRAFEVSGRGRTTRRIDSAEVRATTYVWQPWFVQLSGGLGVLGSHLLSGEESGVTGPTAAQDESTAVTGHGTVVVFPMSRFPFQARAERTDSRAEGAVSASDYTSTRYGIRQDYRPNGSATNFSLSADRSVLESRTFGRDTLDVWEARMSGRSGQQRYDLSAKRASNSRGLDGESDSDRLNVLHGYRHGPNLSVDSMASTDRNVFRERGPLFSTERRSQTAQLTTLAGWRPGGHSPWYVTASARVFKAEVDNQGVPAESRTISANVGANYQMNRQTTLNGSASVTEVLTDTRRDLLGTLGGGISYIPDVIPLGPFLYNRSLGASATHQTGGLQGDTTVATAQFGHGVTRSIVIDGSSTAGVNLGQSVSVTDETLRGRTDTLSHSAGLSWSGSPGEGSSAYASLNAADLRRRGATDEDFQLVNLQVTGQFRFSRFALGSANFTSQATRSSNALSSTDGFDTNASGSLGYQHSRAFGVPGLGYYAVYSVNESQFATRQLGNLNAVPDQFSQSLEQRLEYIIGRLETRLLARVVEIQATYHWLVFLRVTRRFGAF